MDAVDVIIPVYKPDERFVSLIELLEKQTWPVHQIIIMNTEQKYWDQLLFENSRWHYYPNLSVTHLSKREFDHGRTRREGVLKSQTPFFVMMTQDAMPQDLQLIGHLMAQMADPKVAAAYARQLPAEDAGPVERFTRNFNYPDTSRKKTKADLQELGIKTYFCSNVCACYRREIYDRLGGFVREAIFNEDMIYAAACIENGYTVAYAADAEVVHSHQYDNRTQLRRNFDLGVSQADHPEVFDAVPPESEGKRLVKLTVDYLNKNGYRRLVLPLLVTSFYKWYGYRLGKRYRQLSRKKILKVTMNPVYWERHWSKQ